MLVCMLTGRGQGDRNLMPLSERNQNKDGTIHLNNEEEGN